MKRQIALGFALVGLSGCAAVPQLAMRDVPQAMLETPNTVIRAVDGSFELVAGQAATTPFYSTDCPLQPAPDTFQRTADWGAQQVVIELPNRAEPIYGLLAFCPIPEAASGPATRIALVQVPDSYVAETEGGRLAVVFEMLRYVYQPAGDGRAVAQWPVWILYLSQQPFGSLTTPVESRQLGGSAQ